MDETEFGRPPEPPRVAWAVDPAENIADPDTFWVGTSASSSRSDVQLD